MQPFPPLAPSYSFIEPNHWSPVHLSTTPGSGAEHSNNQHPANNLVPNADYDSYMGNGGDFQRGEQLIATVYEALRSNPTVFERTLLLVTYDVLRPPAATDGHAEPR